MFLSPSILGPVGLQIDTIDFVGTWSGSGNISVGSCVLLDTQQATATTFGGGATSIFAHLQVPNQAVLQAYKFGTFAIYMSKVDGTQATISQGTKGIFRLVGNCRALIENDDADVDTVAAIGFPVWADADRQLHVNGETLATDLRKCLGWLNEASVYTDDLTLRNISFNGLGIGMVFTSA